MERNIGFFEAYKVYWKKTFKMKGRARRKEYWYPTLITIGITFILMIIGAIIDHQNGTSLDADNSVTENIRNVWALINFIPSFTLMARRLQDINMNGWWALLPNLGIL